MISQVIVNELKVLSSESRSNGCIEHARGIMEQEKASENLSKNISATSLSGNEKKLEKFLMENWTVTNLQLAIIPTTGKQLLLALMSFHLPSRQCPATQIFRIRHMMSFSSHHLTVGLEKTKKAAVAPASLPDFGVEFAVSLCHPFSFGLGSSIIIYLFMQLCKPEFSLSPTTYS
ncbi:unnamed protein product [Cuscuta europaea]|uniref:Uncharacterized protein n=1 Tax=Cuscuta europaea TaxID=41803 RepID=A0A9P1E4S6_CUSEU|nr:unnamed protein product [Cuscuta europaea]